MYSIPILSVLVYNVLIDTDTDMYGRKHKVVQVTSKYFWGRFGESMFTCQNWDACVNPFSNDHSVQVTGKHRHNKTAANTNLQ